MFVRRPSCAWFGVVRTTIKERQWKVKERQWKVKERQWKVKERQWKFKERHEGSERSGKSRKGSGRSAIEPVGEKVPQPEPTALALQQRVVQPEGLAGTIEFEG